jgi:SHS2 domain-containing protein
VRWSARSSVSNRHSLTGSVIRRGTAVADSAMREFEINDRYTVSDAGIALRADSLTELFIAGAEGMFAIILGDRPPKPETESHDVQLHADTPEQLMIDWLSELLYEFDTDGLIPVHFDVSVSRSDNESHLSGTISYRRYDRERDNAEHEIKAVTYYKINIKKDGDVYRCDVVFDL